VSCLHEFDSLISLLLAEEDYVVEDTVVEEHDDMVEREPQAVNGKTQKVKVIGNLIGLLENLDNEVKSSSNFENSDLICFAVYQNPATHRRA